MEWKLSGSPRKKAKVTPSAGKVLVTMLKCLWRAIRRKCVFIMKVWFSSVPMADCTWHSNLLQKFCWLMLDYPSHSPDLAPVIFMFPTLKEHCQDIVSPVMKMSNVLPLCGWCNRSYVPCVWDGHTDHILWQVPQPSRELCSEIMYQWHLHCVMSVCSTKPGLRCMDTTNLLYNPPSCL